MNAPCRGCVDRELGCHTMCELYKAFVKQQEEIRKNRLKDIAINAHVHDTKIKVKKMHDAGTYRSPEFGIFRTHKK